MGAGNKPRRVELDLHSLGRLGLRLRVMLRSPLPLERCLGLAQRRAPPLARPQPLGQLIAARLPVEFVLPAVRLRRLGQNLASDLLIAAIGGARGVRLDRRAIDRDHADPDQPRLPAKREDRGEQPRQRLLVAAPKLSDRRVIRDAVGANHPVGHVLLALPLDPARRAITPRVGIEQQRHHHPRVIGRAAMPIGAVVGLEGGQVNLLDRLKNRPHQVVLGHPVAQRRGIKNACSRSHSMKFGAMPTSS
jgi:hypothetical protein